MSKISFISWLWLLLMLPLTFVARFQNHENIFLNGKIFFVDGDCYSRMTRVRMVMEHPLSPVHHHEFENYPEGTKAHTTAPMDYLIAGLAVALKPFSSQPIDLAGALVSPLLGCATLIFLWFWAIRMQFRHALPMLLLFAVSPILVHGTALGRPDHQSLLIFLLAIAIGCEWVLISIDSLELQIFSGLAWGTSLWVSFYEPLILLLVLGSTHFFFSRKTLIHSERWYWLGAALVPLVLMLLIDGAPFELPNSAIVQAFARWKNSIGELSTIKPLSPLLFQWTGLLLYASPLLLIRKYRGPLLLLVMTYGLTLWQVRWGYFLGLVFVMTLPWQLEQMRRPWLIWTLFIVSLWPVLHEWDQRLFPDEARSERLATERMEAYLLRDIGEQLRSPEKTPILAPWWMCPPLAYWSGQPAVAGSSHESLPGIMDTARFYLSRDPATAEKIIRDRGVKRVLVCEPSRILETSQPLVDGSGTGPTLVEALYEHPHTVPSFLRLSLSNQIFKVFSVEPVAPGPK